MFSIMSVVAMNANTLQRVVFIVLKNIYNIEENKKHAIAINVVGAIIKIHI
jgi:hypothetical protein